MGGKGDQLGIDHGIIICPFYKIVESVTENETHKILRDFEIQTDHQIPARRPNLMLINKKQIICQLVGFAIPADP